MLTRRNLLASAALAPLLAVNIRAAQAQEETVPDLSGVTPLPLTDDRLATFEAYVATTLAETGVPGASIAVVQHGEVAFLQGFGVRELGRPALVTADTMLRIGSVTKSFSSLLTATLVDAGRLTWETPLVNLLPDFAVADPALTPRLTVGDAFCSCSGLPRRDLEFQFRAHDLTPERLIEEMVQLPLTAPFGEKYQYNNQLVAVGGYAAAVADGGAPDDLSHAYAIALRERVLNPIGMPRTTDALDEVVAGDDYAVPHAADIAGALRPLPLLEDDLWLLSVALSGALWSSAREMARYVQTELGRGISADGTRVVSATNLERTWQPGIMLQVSSGTPAELAAVGGHYGLGWIVGAYGGQRLLSHGGATLGFTALVAFLPEADFGVVVLTNGLAGTASPFTFAVLFRLLELLFDQPVRFETQLAARLASAAAGQADLLAHLGQVDPRSLAPYLRRYANPALGPLALTLQDDALLIELGAMRPELRPLLDDAGAVTGYVFVDPPLGGFPPPMTLTLEEGAGNQPRIVLTVPADLGEADLVYPFEPVAAAGTPTP